MDASSAAGLFLVFLFLLFGTANGGPAPQGVNDPVGSTLSEMMGEMQAAIEELDRALRQPACLPAHSALLDQLRLQPLLAERLAAFRCRLQHMSRLIPELAQELLSVAQSSRAVEKRIGGAGVGAANSSCSLPHFEDDLEKFLYARCLLQRLSEDV